MTKVINFKEYQVKKIEKSYKPTIHKMSPQELQKELARLELVAEKDLTSCTQAILLVEYLLGFNLDSMTAAISEYYLTILKDKQKRFIHGSY